MPYATAKELPKAAQKLPGKAKRQFRAAFNAAFKTYDGDEKRAFATAWSAVKKKYQKKNGVWMARQTAEVRPMNEFLSRLHAVYEGLRGYTVAAGVEKIDTAQALLKELDGAATFERLQELSAVPAGETLEQARRDYPGSLQDHIEAVCNALKRQEPDYLGDYGWVMAVYPEYVVTCAIDRDSGYEPVHETEYWKVAYTLAAETNEVTFGDAEPVDIQTIVVPRGEEEDEDEETEQGAPPADLPATQETDDRPDWLKQGQDPPGGSQTLTQQQSTLLQVESYDEETGVMVVKGVATTGNVVNAMKQVYPTEVWQDNMPRMKRLAAQGKLLGECMHPQDGRPTLDRTCAKFTEVELERDQVTFQAEILPTEPYGKLLQTLIKNGVSVDVSSRGAGEMKQGEWNGVKGVYIVKRGFRNDAFDFVISGASPGATIHEWAMQSQSADTPSEEIEETPEMKETLDKLAASMETLAAAQAKQAEILTTLTQAKDEGVKSVETVKDEPQSETPVTQATQNPALDASMEKFNALTAIMEKQAVQSATADLIRAASQEKKWGPQWVNMYEKFLKNAKAETLEALQAANERAAEVIEQMIADAPQFPGVGFTVQKDVGERGFKNGNEVIDELTRDLPDSPPDDGMNWFRQQDENGNAIVPGWHQTPRRQCKKLLDNIARAQDAHWNGPAAMQGLIRLSQGFSPDLVAEQVMTQACADGTTAVGAGGAPQSAIFIFPLVRRLFPMLIVNELASVQPLDRPDAKIFYLDVYRQTTGVDSVDEAGATVSDRMRIDRSDSFSDSYADDPGECNTSNFLQLKLSAKSVSAETKKLHSEWTIEEVQDLRAYHGLDASLELVGALAKEIALEWNQVVLNEMVSTATAGTRIFGTTAPSGYTQKEWDEYITRYVEAVSFDIFKHRHGVMTHIVSGPDAWLKLSSTSRVGVQSQTAPTPELYPGLTLTPFMGISAPNVRTYVTNFWTQANANKILIIRRGPDWSDTPYVWAPYIDYVSPIVHNGKTMTQHQGVMSRAAHKTVVGNAMGIVQIVPGATGVPL